MPHGKMRCKKSSLSSLSPVEVMGLEPTTEEIALNDMESGNETRPVESTLAAVVQEEKGTSLGEQLEIYFNMNPEYNIHQGDDIDICSNFLIGYCPQFFLCPQHHTVFTYVWQLRDKVTNTWGSMDDGAQQVLERLFSDPAKAQVTGIHQGSEILIDLTCMKVHNSQVFDHVRRLSTSSSPTVQFHTTYKYYYETRDDVWEEFSPDFVKCIEDGLRNNCEEVFCLHSSFKYALHLTNMVQTNIHTGTKRRMRRRPVFRSSVLMSSKLWTPSGTLAPGLPNSTAQSNSVGSVYPKTWLITKNLYDDKPLTCVDSEYTYVYTNFHKTMPEYKYIIHQISRIQNYFQWDKYFRKRAHMAASNSNIDKGCLERYLFHGTDATVIEAICKLNFDPRVSGKHGTVYGKGCYFAKDASYAHGYSPTNSDGYRFMFLAKVLVGRPSLGKSSYARPPSINPEDPASLLYDSCVNKSINPDIFIVFDNDQFYPYFLIKYHELQNLVLLD
ncbi:protein mono-ADP-ribosyltransferase TIPARP-like [Mixophyes fleayi]|uniref:protein mono-ADP-ribosyltransferase TIPARP-like n=1 Tax=Mixophyes fleayi TaxID=3061075 RepID=UPI003F4E0335